MMRKESPTAKTAKLPSFLITLLQDQYVYQTEYQQIIPNPYDRKSSKCPVIKCE